MRFKKTINYIEKNIFIESSADTLVELLYSSASNFQRAFSIITGYSVGEYVRNRRLTLAADKLLQSGEAI